MAIEKTYMGGTVYGGIQLGNGFDLQAKAPLDSRQVVPEYAGLQKLIDGAAAYEGMTVYDEETKKTYQAQLVDGALKFVEFGNNVEFDRFTVDLGEGGWLGGYRTGDVIDDGTDIKTVLKTLLRTVAPPTYVHPTLQLSIEEFAYSEVGGAIVDWSPIVREYGTNITLNITSTFTQNDAGDVYSHYIYLREDGVDTLLDGSVGYLCSASKTFQITEEMPKEFCFYSTASYGQGPIKYNSLGEPDDRGYIKQDRITSPTFKYEGFYQHWYYCELLTDSSEALTGDMLRTSRSHSSGIYYKATTGPCSRRLRNRKRVVFACRADKTGVVKVTMPSAMNADCTAEFKKQADTIIIPGANGYGGIPYNIWVYEPAYISDDQTFEFTLE